MAIENINETINCNIHNATEEFLCTICDVRFKNYRNLWHHAKLHDNSKLSKPFECNECASKFGTKQNLTRHIQSHYGIKNFM